MIRLCAYENAGNVFCIIDDIKKKKKKRENEKMENKKGKRKKPFY